MKVRVLLVGLLLGLLLAFSRAPLGLGLGAASVVGAWDSALFRAGALAVCACAFLPGLRLFAAGIHSPTLLGGSALGFALPTLVLPVEFAPDSRSSWIEVLVVALAALVLLTRRPPKVSGAAEPKISKIALTGYFACGLGAASAFEATSRPLRLMGGARAQDDAVFALAGLAWLAVGAMAFAPLWSGRVWRTPLAVALIALASASCLESLGFLELISTRDPLEQFVRRYGLDLSQQGMLAWDALLGARCFALPGLIAGAALGALRSRASWCALLCGAATATLAFPTLVRATVEALPVAMNADDPLGALAFLPAQRVAWAALVAALGASVAAFVAVRSAAPSRVAQALLASLILCAAIVPWTVRHPAALPLSPWARFAIVPDFVRELPEGLLTVESAPGPTTVVTLDRRRLTPLATEQTCDDAQIDTSLALAGVPAPRVLLLGPLTAARWVLLRGRGIETVHRVWIGAPYAAEIERLLVGDLPATAGESAPSEELERLARASDLLIAPAVEGGGLVGLPATLDGFDVPTVAWIRAVDGAATGTWERVVTLAIWRFEDLAIGLANHSALNAAGGNALNWFAPGEPCKPVSPLMNLRTRPLERSLSNLRCMAERLAVATAGLANAPLSAALRDLLAAQVRSSPYENSAQAVELPQAALTNLCTACMLEPNSGPRLFAKHLAEFVASTLSDKREVEPLLQDFAPLAERFAPWPTLERAIARGDWELLDYAAAATRLKLAANAAPYDLRLGAWHAEALLRAGHPAEAAEVWERMLNVQPGRRDFARWRAIALARAGAAGAGEAVEAALLIDPEDELLRSHVGMKFPTAPLPPPIAGVLPGEGLAEGASVQR